MRVMPLLFVILLSVLTSCSHSEKEKQLEERENSLIIKEKEFAAKEDEYRNLLTMRDSMINKADSATVKTLPVNILGEQDQVFHLDNDGGVRFLT